MQARSDSALAANATDRAAVQVRAKDPGYRYRHEKLTRCTS